jgi:DNA integrity scanning protein DisA with diadenylate cyclase activity
MTILCIGDLDVCKAGYEASQQALAILEENPHLMGRLEKEIAKLPARVHDHTMVEDLQKVVAVNKQCHDLRVELQAFHHELGRNVTDMQSQLEYLSKKLHQKADVEDLKCLTDSLLEHNQCTVVRDLLDKNNSTEHYQREIDDMTVKIAGLADLDHLDG